MYVARELQRLQERVNKLAVAKKPPTLRMFLIKEGDREVPLDEDELTQWDLICTIQKKPVNA
jgi:hypothetical protein